MKHELNDRETRHGRMRRMAAEAMDDPLFVADMRQTMTAFKHVDREHWPDFDDEDLIDNESSATPRAVIE